MELEGIPFGEAPQLAFKTGLFFRGRPNRSFTPSFSRWLFLGTRLFLGK
jgi:hypothetical protein